jgi:hypothetical protein
MHFIKKSEEKAIPVSALPQAHATALLWNFFFAAQQEGGASARMQMIQCSNVGAYIS